MQIRLAGNKFASRFAIKSLPKAARQSVRAMASAEPVYEIIVKGDATTGTLADCPFSHRALLVLEEKSVPHVKTLIDLDNKPQWLLDINPAGSVPVMKDLADGTCFPDSGLISDMLEERFPEPKLGTVEGSPQVATGMFGAFKGFAKATPEEAAEKEAALMQQLEEVDAFLVANGGPYIGGATPCATDARLMPQLYHTTIALKHFRNWEMPAHLKAVRAYMEAFMARDSWKNTYYSPELVIKGWERHGITKQ